MTFSERSDAPDLGHSLPAAGWAYLSYRGRFLSDCLRRRPAPSCSRHPHVSKIVPMCNDVTAGIRSGDACCSPDCVTPDGEPTCGGMGCGRLPGGSTNCCVGTIGGGETFCTDVPAGPCRLDGEHVLWHSLNSLQALVRGTKRRLFLVVFLRLYPCMCS